MTNHPIPSIAERLARASGAALLCVAALLHADNAPPAGSAQIDVAARWQALFEHTDAAALNDTFALISELDAGHGDVDAAACGKHKDEIAHALTVNTVGLAMWYAAYQCALASHETELAEQRLAVFGALSRHAVASRHAGIIDSPIHVLSELDVWAFAHASGQQVLYAYYDAPGVRRELPFTVVLWDEEHKRERMLRFDYLDARARLWNDRDLAELPAFRYGVAKAFIGTFAKSPGSFGAAALELEEAARGDNPAKRIAAMEGLARNGNFAAVIGHAFLCLLPPKSTCAQASVDLLLPWAEKSYAMSLVLLAVAYDEGRGVRRNEDNARKLLQKADERLGDGRGSLLFSSFSMLSDPTQKRLHPLVRKTVEELADQGVPVAEWVAATFDMEQNKNVLSKSALAHLRHAAEADLTEAQETYGLYLVRGGQTEEGVRWLEKAAAADQHRAQIWLARAYEKGDEVAKDPARALAWYKAAGLNGDVGAMLWMASYYAGQPNSKKNHKLHEGWLESAMMKDNVPASLALARQYEMDDGAEGLGDEQSAAEIYRRLDRAHDNADARRRLAGLLVYSKKIERDPQAARSLLQRDIDRGDGKSRLMFAAMQAHGVWGDEQVEAGVEALSALGEAGDLEAFVELGGALYYAKQPHRREAIAAWQRAADGGNRTALNNVAWALCTSADAELLDGARGLELAKKVAPDDDAPAGYRDTLAACYARTGDFAQAERIEQGVLESETARAIGALTARARGRIADYHARKPYVEKPDAK